MRVALIGCGAIGTVIAKAILAHEIEGIELVAVAEVRPSEEVRTLSDSPSRDANRFKVSSTEGSEPALASPRAAAARNMGPRSLIKISRNRLRSSASSSAASLNAEAHACTTCSSRSLSRT